jgi:hypothetical protein
MAVIDRTDYDQICIRKLMDGLCIEDFHEARQMQDCNYPKSTKAVIDELRFRGLNASEWRLHQLCQNPVFRPEEVAGTFIWSQEAIDRVADEMERCDWLTAAAQRRKELGISYEEEQRIVEQVIAEREVARG